MSTVLVLMLKLCGPIRGAFYYVRPDLIVVQLCTVSRYHAALYDAVLQQRTTRANSLTATNYLVMCPLSLGFPASRSLWVMA